MTGIARRLAALRLRRRRLRRLLCARRGQIEAVLCFLARFGARLRFARAVARAFGARLGVCGTALAAGTLAATSPAAATTASATTTPALTALPAIAAIRTCAALGRLCLLRRSLWFRRRLLRALRTLRALAMLLLAACTLSAIRASCVRLFARLALVALSVTPGVATSGCCFVLVVVTPAAIAISITMMTPVTVTIPVAIAAVATFVPIAPSFVR